MNEVSSRPISRYSPKEKAAYRREEKKLLRQLASRAESLSAPGLDYAELYIGRMLLAQSIRALIDLRVEP
jgi:hypothetical protein